MLELTKKYTGVTYDIKGIEEAELREIVFALEEYERRSYRDVFSYKSAQTLSNKLKDLMAVK